LFNQSQSLKKNIFNHQNKPKMSNDHQIAKIIPPKSEITLEQYKRLHQQSIEDPETFWGKAATEHLDWFRPFDKVLQGSFEHGDIRWFQGGKLNLSYNALDRHLHDNKRSNSKRSNEIALVWEGDEPNDIRRLTYEEVLRKVCQIANAMLRMGVKKGDIVTLYMPMIPE
jgi:acetyl-CoA synthetase